MDDHPKRITNITAGLIIGTALFIDIIIAILAWIPYVGWIINIAVGWFAFMSFWLWFKLKEISLASLKKKIAMAGLNIVGLLPFLGVIPGWTLSVILIIIWSRVEDKALSEEQREQFDQFLLALRKRQFEEAKQKANEIRRLKQEEIEQKQQVDSIRKTV